MYVTQILGEWCVGLVEFYACLFLLQMILLLSTSLNYLSLIFRPPTVFEVIANMWNSSAFNPVVPASECHYDFQEATNCSYDLVAGLTPATPQRIEDIFTSMRSDLLRIISRWEQSGQGKGERDQESDAEEDQEGKTDEEEEAIVAEQQLLDDNVSFMTSQTN
jgi:hypothetical protein